MLISKTVEIKWNSKIKQHYVDLGYEFTKMKDSFVVKTGDLTQGSNVVVDVKCDYCGKEYQEQWYRYFAGNHNSVIHKDCCNACKKYKIQETSMFKYGVKSVLSLDEVKDRIKKTNLERYGVENPFASEDIKQKIIDTAIDKYGVEHFTQSQVVKEKTAQTCIEKYGVKAFLLTQIKYGEDNPRWKGGVEYHRNERATQEYKEWRCSVYKRDNYTCQCCGDRSRKNHPVRLEAHHIFNWNDNSDKRYEIDNGITLCQDCHTVFHMIYGKKDNTDLQLKDFLFDYGKKIC